jgi:NAD+ synthase (glutamine-hydrolysing)
MTLGKEALMFDGFVSVATRAPRVRVADVASNLEACVAAAREAAGQGAKVVVLPQLCLTGCTCGDLFGQDILLDVAEEAVLS